MFWFWHLDIAKHILRLQLCCVSNTRISDVNVNQDSSGIGSTQANVKA